VASDPEYTVAELAREVQRALASMSSLAARLEGGQFMSSQVFSVWSQGLDNRLKTLEEKVNSKADVEKAKAIEAEINSLKDDRKWLVRLLVTFIVMTVLGVVFAAAGGVPK
jgi:hypothetical protein